MLVRSHILMVLPLGIALLALNAVASVPVHAGWLTRLAKEAGEAGGSGARKGAGQLDEAASQLKNLPKVARAGAVAASVSGEGHWTFINKAGQRFTAANDAEMGRLSSFLFPEGVGPAGLNIYVTRDSVFKYREALEQLPKRSKVWLSDGKRAYQLRYRAGRGDAKPSLFAQVRRDLFVPLDKRELFDEAVWRLERPFKRSSVRVLSLTADGPASLPVVSKSASKAGKEIIEKVDPRHITSAISPLKGQTVVLTGRLAGDNLVYRSARGSEADLDLAGLRRAAAANDIDLVLLNSPAPRQPGVRNWLWQTVGIDGLGTALNSETYGDFVGSLAGGGRKLEVRVARSDSNRTVLSVVNFSDGVIAPGSETIGDVIAEVASEVAGSVVTTAIEVHGTSAERSKELDRRIVPGISSDVQFGFIVMVVAGMLGLPVAWRWWRWVWPQEERTEYGGWLGYRAAQLVRFIFFLLFFLPLIGVPAMIWNFALQVWAWLTFPWRAMKWLFGLGQAKTPA
ncbi:MAG: hypothetical protein AAGD43_25235 [Pseudomonadota bacterium]